MMNKKLLAVAFALVMAVVLSGAVSAADEDTVSDYSSGDLVTTTSTNTALPDPYVVETGISYTTIQAAIDSVFTEDGMTIQVEAGPYPEDVLVWKSLIIVGENVATTTVNSFYITSSGSGSDISGFTITGGTGEAITLQDATDCAIHGNLISGGYSAGVALVNSDNNEIYQNAMDNWAGANYYGIYLENSNMNDIYLNVINNSIRDGIWLYESDLNKIYENYIGFNENGILVELSDNNTISSNNIYNSISDGIFVSDSFGTIIDENNYIHHNGDDGVTVTDSDSTTIDANDIYSNGDDGVDIMWSDDVEITDNEIYSNGWDGIYLYESTFLIDNNIIYLNIDDGIDVSSCAEFNITTNEIYQNTWNGIELNNSLYFDVTGNEIYSQVVDNGIEIFNCDYFTVTDNLVYLNTMDGVNISDSSGFDVNDNDIYQNTDEGIDLDSCSEGLIDPNLIHDNLDRGIEMKNSEHIGILDNEIYNNSKVGIYVDSCFEIGINGNWIYQNGEWGVYLMNSNRAEIDDNTINNNSLVSGHDGIALNTCSEISITNNDIYNNENDGIQMYNSSQVYVFQNDIHDNDYGVNIFGTSLDVTMNFNRIVDNITAGLLYTGSDDVDATLNWWGYNAAVDVAAQINDAGTGTLTYDPWIVLAITANPGSVGIGGTSTITADLLHDSDGLYHNPANGVVPYTGLAGFAAVPFGTIVDVAFVNGVATSTLTGLNTAGTVTVSSTVDHATVTTNVVVNPAVSIADLITAAGVVKAFYELNGVLPANVLVGAQVVTMPEFLYYLVTATLNINVGNLNPINTMTVNPAPNPGGSYTHGNLLKASYLTVANNIRNFILTNGRAPNYAQTSLGKIPFSKLVYMYSKVINFYGNIIPNRLPNYVYI